MDALLELLVIGISIGMVYGLVALGIALIYSGLDIVNFAHGEMYMFGAFFGVVLFKDLGVFYPITLVLSVILTALLGALIERFFFRRLTRMGGGYTVAGMGIIICGFGMSFVLQNIAFLIWDPTPKPFPVNFGAPLVIGEIILPRSYLWIFVITIFLMTVLHLFLKKTKLGLAIRAVAHNKEIAFLMGINVTLIISLVFAIASGLAAAGGVLIGPINYVQVQMGYLILIKAFAATVVGGFGSLPGAIIGGLIVGIVETMGSYYLSVNHKDIYAFLLLISVLTIRPAGILGVIAKVKA